MVDQPLAFPPMGTDDATWDAACSAVRAYCGWHVAPNVVEEVTLDGSGGSVQMLPTLLLTNLVTITNDGTLVDSPEWSSAGMVRGCWTGKFRGVVAVMEHGFDECPADVVGVLGEMVAAAGRGGVEQVTSGPHAVRFAQSSIDSRQRSVLDHYRIPALS